MSQEIGVKLDEYAIAEFLKHQGLGVLGLAKNDIAYTIPIAFAYDEDGNRCIFRFLMGERSKKQDFVDETDTACLTVYEWRGTDDWTSVVAIGPIHPIAHEDLGHVAAVFSEIGEPAALEVFNQPISAYHTVWYELELADVTGRGRSPSITSQRE